MTSARRAAGEAEKLTPQDEAWLRGYLASLPESPCFNFEVATRAMIADQGIRWVREHAEMLRSQAELVASL